MPDAAGSRDQRFLHAATRIGTGALGTTWPNPAVGAILVNGDRVIAAGRTGRGGRPHAEQQVIQTAGAAAAGGTLYVSLEPCAHHGRTPPCADAIIAAGIARVVVGATDPDTRVSGKGLAALKAAGVSVSLLPDTAAQQAHDGHFARVRTGRPWVTLKLAVSADGMIGRKGGGQVAITGMRASTHVQALRSRYDGILVGRGTVESDDPKLTCRLPGLQQRSPVRIVLDGSGQLDPGAKLFSAGSTTPVLRFVGDPDLPKFPATPAPAETIVAATRNRRLDLADVLARLADFGLTRILVEGGAEIAASFVSQGLADDVILFRSPQVIGENGVSALAGMGLSSIEKSEHFRMISRRRFGDDLKVYYRKAV